ncbi:putative transcription factor MYB-HB-like family [Dioscorea sansibarensis]
MDSHFGWGGVVDGWRKGPWTPQEDKLLCEYVNIHGDGRWNSVSQNHRIEKEWEEL